MDQRQQQSFQGVTTQRDTEDLPANPQIILSWKAPLRPYKKGGKKIIKFYVVLAILLSILVYFFGDIILIIPIFAVLFLFYVLTVTPPPIIENRITKFGIQTAGIVIRWELLSHFYYTQRFSFHILTLVGHAPYFLHSYLIVPDDKTKDMITDILSQHIMFQEHPKRNFTDKMIDWLSHLVPDEEDDNKDAFNKNTTEQVTKNKENPSEKNYTPLPKNLRPKNLFWKNLMFWKK
jgi:hypothetical protein